jgi:hypothetical protein
MKNEEVIKRLEEITLPKITSESHRRELRESLLNEYSKIKEPGKKRYAWTVKRSLYVAVPMVIVLAVVGSLFVMKPFLTPEKVMAKAYTAIETIESYRATYSGAVGITGTTVWLDVNYLQAEYDDKNHRHVKMGSAKNYYPYYEHEVVVTTEKIYARESPSLPTPSHSLETFIEDIKDNPLYSSMPSKENTLIFLSSLISVKKLSTEKIDGILCWHYQANVDIEKRISELKEYAYKDLGLESNDPSIQAVIDYIRARQIDVELWIGKDDYLIHQMSDVVQPIKSDNLISTAVSRITTKYFDFNVPIVIEPPLDSSGKLLPGWLVTER